MKKFVLISLAAILLLGIPLQVVSCNRERMEKREKEDWKRRVEVLERTVCGLEERLGALEEDVELGESGEK